MRDPRSKYPSALLTAGLLGVGSLLPTAQASAQQQPPPAVAGSVGTVETVAGPGFCAAGARRDPSSSEVAAMSVDPAGRVFFDTGPARSALVGRVESDGRATRLVTGLPRPPRLPPSTRGGEPAGASRLAPDGRGGVLIAAGAQVLDIEANNAVTPVAGSPRSGTEGAPPLSGDGGAAVAARLANARSIATDAAGNVYVADEIDARFGTVRIRFVNRTSEPVSFYSGTPEAVVVGPGNIDTIAGAPGIAGGGDGGPAVRAVLQGVPPAMAVVGDRLYIGSSWSEPGLSSPETARVRVINLGGEAISAHGVSVPPGYIHTVAGGGPLGHRGDGGPARSAAFSRLPGIAADPHGNLFMADELNNRVRRVDPSGVVTTVVGRPGTGRQNGGFNGNDRPATDALLHAPFAVAVGPGDRLYVSDRLNHQVRVVDRFGAIRAAPGSGIGLSWICQSGSAAAPSSPPEIPQRGGPAGVVADARGNLYIANPEGQQVVKVDESGVVTTVSGRRRGDRTCLRGERCPVVGDGGPALEAELVRPEAVELAQGSEGLYVFDAARIRFINLSPRLLRVHGTTVRPGAIQTVAGNGTAGATGDGGRATEAQLGSLEEQDFSPVSLAADRRGNLFFGDPVNGRVRQVGATGLISTFAGTSAAGELAACCTDPVGLALDAADNLYVADLGRDDGSNPHPRVWFVNRGSRPSSALGQQVGPGAVHVVAGIGSTTLGFGDEGARAIDSQLLRLTGIALDPAGNLYLAGVGHQEVDRNSQLVGGEGEVRKVDTSGNITLVMGNGQSGFNGDGLKAKLTSVNSPADLAFDACHNLLVADRGNDRVRRLHLTSSPCRARVDAAASATGDGAGRGAVVPMPMVAVPLVGVVVALYVLWRFRRGGTVVGEGG